MFARGEMSWSEGRVLANAVWAAGPTIYARLPVEAERVLRETGMFIANLGRPVRRPFIYLVNYINTYVFF